MFINRTFLHLYVFPFQLSVTIDDDDTASTSQSEERKEIANMVRQKMKKMEIPPEEYGMASLLLFLYHSKASLKALFNNVFLLKNLSCLSLHAISVFDKV